jgi:cytochrome c-type biogenesis protein CcmH
VSAQKLICLLGAVLCLAAAGDPADRLPNPALEGRARALFQETRCLVCQGESIDDSEAPLAADLRRVIRERIAAGASDGQVRAFLTARYGEYVLFRPRFSWRNSVLWTAPFLVALTGLVMLAARRRRPGEDEPALSAEEESRLAALQSTGDTLAPELGSKNAPGLTER